MANRKEVLFQVAFPVSREVAWYALVLLLGLCKVTWGSFMSFELASACCLVPTWYTFVLLTGRYKSSLLQVLFDEKVPGEVCFDAELVATCSAFVHYPPFLVSACGNMASI